MVDFPVGRLKALEGKSVEFQSVDEGKPADLANLQKSCPAPSTLILKLGAQVILLKNLDTQLGTIDVALLISPWISLNVNHTLNRFGEWCTWCCHRISFHTRGSKWGVCLLSLLSI
jgi:hypothetical protein